MDGRLLVLLGVAGVAGAAAVRGSRGVVRTMDRRVSVKQVLEQLSRGTWDVGDQGADNGFVVRKGDQSFLVWVEGWGPECVNASECDAKAFKKMREGANAWVEARRPYEGLVSGPVARGEADLVSFSGFELTSEEDEVALQSRGEDFLIELDS